MPKTFRTPTGINCIVLLILFFLKLEAIGQKLNRPEALNEKFKKLSGGTIRIYEKTDKLKVFVFFSPECPLCINYTSIVSDLQREYSDKVDFYGIFSGKHYKRKELKSFIKKYKLEFPFLLDLQYKLADLLNAKVTPECVLADSNGRIYYSGAIDDRAPAPGQFRNYSSMNFLEMALKSTLAGEPIEIDHKEAVGCFIHP